MLDDAVRCLNQFPWKIGISATMSPASLVLGHATPDFTKMRLEFGTYVQVFEDNDPTNTPRARSLGAIALNPTGNAQGDYYFLSLASGFTLSRHNWTALPMTDTAIARVEALALADDQPLIQERGFVVEWRHNQPIDNDEYDRLYELPHHVAPDLLPADELIPIDAQELHDLHIDAVDHHLLIDPAAAPVALAQGAHEDEQQQQQHNPWIFEHKPPVPPVLIDEDEYDEHDEAYIEEYNEEHEDEHIEDKHIDEYNEEHEDEHENEHEHEGAENEGAHDTNNHEHEGAKNEGAPNANNNDHETEEPSRYNLRERGMGHSTRFRDAMDNPHDGKSYYPPTQLMQLKRYVYGHVMTQMTAKAGIKKHGKAAEEALMMEFAQLEDLHAYESLDVATLTKEQRTGALRAINLIKEKRNGKLKGRTVADGSVQRSLYDKSETTSPTVSSDALMLSIMIDAYEGRDVATADIAGAYLKAYMDDFVVMKFTGESVDILCTLNPGHIKFVTSEKGGKVLYVRLIKALYGCVKSSLLWYKLFTSSLKDMNFVKPIRPVCCQLHH